MAERKRKRVRTPAARYPGPEPAAPPARGRKPALTAASQSRLLVELQDAADAIARARATRGLHDVDAARLAEASRLVGAVLAETVEAL